MLRPSLVLSQSRPLRYGTFFYLYVMQGIPSGFVLTAVTNYLTAEGLDARAIGTFGALVGLPWGVKFIWGPLVDRYQGSPMGRRRPWVLASQSLAFLASLGILFIDDPIVNFSLLAWAFAGHGLFASVQDISVDAMAISVVPFAERGRANAFMKIGMATGQALGAAGLAFLLRNNGFHTAALTQSAILFTFTLVTFFIRERPIDILLPVSRPTSQEQPAIPAFSADERPHLTFGPLMRELVRSLLVPSSLLLFLAVATVFVGERLFQKVYYFSLIRNLGWSDTSVSVLSGTYGTLVAVALALLGGWLADRVGAFRVLMGMTLVMGALHLGFSFAAPTWVSREVATAGLVIQKTLEPLFSIAALPVLMGLCRRSVEGAQFAVYMALSNQADIAGIYLSGQLLPFLSAPAIGMGCGVAMLAASVGMSVAIRRMAPAGRVLIGQSGY